MSAEKLSKIEANVLGVIKRNPGTEDDDMFLLERYWVEVDGWHHGKSIRHNTHPETISKRRRDLHRWGFIKYSEDVLKEREDAFKAEREANKAKTHNMWPW